MLLGHPLDSQHYNNIGLVHPSIGLLEGKVHAVFSDGLAFAAVLQ